METPDDKPEPAETQRNLMSDAQCHLVLTLALVYARRNGIMGEDSEDQAQEFLLHLWLHIRDHPQADPSLLLSAAWLARTADNWMKNGRRAQRRRQLRELEWPSDMHRNGDVTPFSNLPAKEPLPYTEAIRTEFCQRIHGAIKNARLTPAQYELVDHLLAGEQPGDIARRMDCSADVIYQRIRTLRLRLRKALRDCGLGEAEIQEYLSILNLSPPPS